MKRALVWTLGLAAAAAVAGVMATAVQRTRQRLRAGLAEAEAVARETREAVTQAETSLEHARRSV